MGLKELQAWRLVRLSHRPGDRREYFDAPGDAWEIFLTLAEERRRREVEPTLTMLRDALIAPAVAEEDRHVQRRLREMHDFIELGSDWFAEIRRLDPRTLRQLMKMGARVQKLLEMRDKLKVVG
jgi:DNA-binding transcriptional regulator GbsR (MarR family)